ncbi:MAG: hypothetical protein V9E82_00170 [Candidatus Nanopelagicales bacterium]
MIPSWIVDETIYDSGVDVSRPIAPGWTYATSASEPVLGFAITMLLLVAFESCGHSDWTKLAAG